MKERMDGLWVTRVALPKLPRHIPLARGIWQMSCAAFFALPALRVPRPDVALIYSPPLPLGLSGWLLAKLRRVPFLLNVQDLFPQSVIDLGILRNQSLIRLFERMERFVYRHAAHITVHSSGNRDHVIRKGTSPEKVTVMPNWVDTNFLRPGPRLNEFRRELGLEGEFVISFAGILGYSQDLDTVLASAGLLLDYPEIVFLIVGDGVEKVRLKKKSQEMGLSNVRFLPMQPRERYLLVLQASDVSLITLHAKVKTPVVPSKILSAMATGRPLIVALDLAGDAPKLVREASCGVVLPPEDPDVLAKAVLDLYNDRDMCMEMGKNGHEYAERNLSLHNVAEQYERRISQILKD